MKDPNVDSDSGRDSRDGSSVASGFLLRLKGQDPEAWRRLVRLFGPVVFGWCRRAGLHAEDAADVGQEVFQAVATHIADFRRERPGDTFRGWLWTITQNKLRDFWRRRENRPEAAGGTTAMQAFLQVPGDESADSIGSGAHDVTGGLLHRALELIRGEFEERTWQAFWRVAVEGQVPADVAADLGMSAGAVYIAKSRVIHRLREELGDLFE